METQIKETFGITNANIPEILLLKIQRVHEKVNELQILKEWLKLHPVNPDETLIVRQKIGGAIRKAFDGVKVLNDFYPKESEEINERAFTTELNEYCEDLFNIRLTFDIQS